MSIPAGYHCNQWGWFWKDDDNSGPYFLGSDGEMHQFAQQDSGASLTRDAWGVSKVSMPYSLFHGMWTFDIPPTMWFMYHNGMQVYTSNNIISVGGVAKLFTDVTVPTSVIMDSRECPRYQPNRGHLFSTALWCPNKVAGVTREWGLFTASNGVFFRLKNNGNLYACLKSGGTVTHEELIDTSVISGFDVEKNNIYDIQFQWRSAGNYKFFIGDPATGGSKLVHTFSLLGTLTSASIENPALPAAFKVTNAGGYGEMFIGCADITTENGEMGVHQYNSAYAEAVPVSGTDVSVIVIHNPITVPSGALNTRTIQLARISVTCSKKAVFKVWSTRNAAALPNGTLATMGLGSFVKTDSPNTVATAVRMSGPINSALCNNVIAAPVEALVSRSIDNPLRERITFPLVRGDYLIVTCTASTATADVVVEWGEQI